MANEWEKSQVKLFLKIKSYLPKSHLFYYLFLVFKLLPLIILTHDWNLNYGKGVSPIISQFTLCPIMTKIKNQNVTLFIFIAVFVFSLLAFIFCLTCKLRLSRHDHLIRGWNITFQLTTYFLFFVNFLLSQQIYGLIIENFFSEATFSSKLHQITQIIIGNNMNVYLFYICVALQVIMIVFCIFVSCFMSIIFFEPLYFSNMQLTNNIGEINWNWSVFSCIQLVNQLEYHLPFNYFFYIKAVCRGLYIIYCIKWFIDQGNRYYSNHIVDRAIIFTLSICFISSIIEYMFIYDFETNLTLLTSNVNYIVLKLVMEIILSGGIVAYIQNNEITYITFLNSSKGKDGNIYSSFNRLFYYTGDPTKNKTLSVKIFNSFHQEIQDHKMNCNTKEKGCFCQHIVPEDFLKQSVNFFFVYENQKTKVSGEKKNLKDQFISLYSYIEQLITNGISKKNNKCELNQYLLVCVLFYLEFDKNITKAFYFLEEYMKSSQYRTNIICQVQVRIIRKYIKQKFYSMMEKSSDMSFKKHFIDFKNIIHYNQIECSIRRSVDSYYNFLNRCSIPGITQEAFFASMTKLSKEIKLDNELFIHYFKNNKCLHLHLCAELTIYYRFFFHDTPYNISQCFKELTKMEELIKFESNKQIILTFANSNNSHFTIEYATDMFLQDLRYASINDIAQKNFNELMLTSFSDIYDNYIREEVHKGNTSLMIPHLFLFNSQLKILLFSFKAIVVMMGNTLKIFGTFVSFDDLKRKEYNKHKAKGKEKRVKACYAVLSKSGRILGVNDEFEKYFFISSKLISKCKINLYQDILKATPKKNKKNLFVKPLVIYTHLLELHESQMLENNQREYVQIFKSVKDIMEKLQKFPIAHHFIFNFDCISLQRKEKVKEYSLVYLSLEGEQKKSLSSFEKYLGTPKKSEIEVYNSYTQQSIPLHFKFENEPADIIEKLTLIKLQALKVLFFILSINGDIIKNFIEKKVDLDKEDSNPCVEHRETIFSLNNKAINKKLKIKSSLIKQFTILIVVLIIFSIALIAISLYKHYLYTNGETIVYCGLYFQMVKRTLTVVLSLVLNLQLKANHVYNNTIDNFPHTDGDLITALDNAIIDYKEFLKKFKDLFRNISGFENPSVGFLGDLAAFEQEHIFLNKSLKSKKVNSTLSKSLNAIHYKVSKIINQGFLFFMNFNSTGSDNVTQYNQKYFDDSYFNTVRSDQFVAEDASVFIIENVLTNIRYPFIEGLNKMDVLVGEHISTAKNSLLFICLANSCLLSFILIYQGIFYYFLNQKIFSKAFINYFYIQYFNVLLLKKTQMLKDYMEVATMETTVKIILTRVVIKNREEESNLIASKTEQIESNYAFDIAPFEVSNEEITLSDHSALMNHYSNSLSIITTSPRYINNIKTEKTNKPPVEKKVLRMKNQAIAILKAVLKKSVQKSTTINEELRNTITNSSQTSNNLLNCTMSQQQQNQPLQNQSNQQKTQTKTEDLRTNESALPNPKLSQKLTPKMPPIKQNSILQRGSIIGTIILFSLFCLFGFVCSIVYFFLFSYEFKLITNYSVVQFQTLVRLDCFHEILPGLQLALLKNRPLMVDYNSTGFLTNNGGTNREVIPDLLRDFFFFESQFRQNVIDQPQFVFNEIIQFDSLVRSDDFCKKAAELVDNTVEGDFYFTHLERLTKEDFLYRCETIGNGFNKNGFFTAMVSLINHESNLYADFMSNGNRDADYNFNKMNDKNLQIHFAETFFILDFVMLKYQQVLSKEYTSTSLALKTYSDIYIIFAVLFIAIIAWIYEEMLLKKYLIDVDSLELTEILIYHSVIF